MVVLRVMPDPVIQEAIVEAAAAFEDTIRAKETDYRASLATHKSLYPTKRRVEQEMFT